VPRRERRVLEHVEQPQFFFAQEGAEHRLAGVLDFAEQRELLDRLLVGRLEQLGSTCLGVCERSWAFHSSRRTWSTAQDLRRRPLRLRDVTFQRGIDGSDPVGAQPISARVGAYEDRRTERSWRLGAGTLACPRCDAPVALGGRVVPLTQGLDCPFCRHAAPLRDFLSLATPTRPARVEVRMRARARARAGAARS